MYSLLCLRCFYCINLWTWPAFTVNWLPKISDILNFDKVSSEIKNLRNFLCSKFKSVRNFSSPFCHLEIFLGHISSFGHENILIFALFFTIAFDRNSIKSDFNKSLFKRGTWNLFEQKLLTKLRQNRQN